MSTNNNISNVYETIMNDVSQLVDKRINEVVLLSEGIIPDYIHNTVKLTMDNDYGVDFSERKYIKYKRNGITVYSIFRRTSYPETYRNKFDYTDDDGNPFIYALKGIPSPNGGNPWSFDISQEEIIAYIRRFLNICKSIDKKYDVIVMAPSKSSINNRFMDVIYKQVQAKIKITDYFLKAYTSDIMWELDVDLIMDDYPSESQQDFIQRDMKRMLGRMGEHFEAKKFKKKYLKYIKSVVTVDDKYTVADSYKLFKGKRVLVLDDVFSSGKTVSDCVKCIDDFEPAKVDVITLLSKRM